MEFTRVSHGGNSKYQLLHQQESFKQIAKSIAKSVNDEDPIMFTQLLAHVLQYLQLMHCFVIPVNFILNQILHQKILLKHLVLGIIMNWIGIGIQYGINIVVEKIMVVDILVM